MRYLYFRTSPAVAHLCHYTPGSAIGTHFWNRPDAVILLPIRLSLLALSSLIFVACCLYICCCLPSRMEHDIGHHCIVDQGCGPVLGEGGFNENKNRKMGPSPSLRTKCKPSHCLQQVVSLSDEKAKEEVEQTRRSKAHEAWNIVTDHGQSWSRLCSGKCSRTGQSGGREAGGPSIPRRDLHGDKLVLHDEQRLCVTYSVLMLRKTSQTVTPGTLFAFVPYVNPW